MGIDKGVSVSVNKDSTISASQIFGDSRINKILKEISEYGEGETYDFGRHIPNLENFDGRYRVRYTFFQKENFYDAKSKIDRVIELLIINGKIVSIYDSKSSDGPPNDEFQKQIGLIIHNSGISDDEFKQDLEKFIMKYKGHINFFEMTSDDNNPCSSHEEIHINIGIIGGTKSWESIDM